jgi:hypothetical protein
MTCFDSIVVPLDEDKDEDEDDLPIVIPLARIELAPSLYVVEVVSFTVSS